MIAKLFVSYLMAYMIFGTIYVVIETLLSLISPTLGMMFADAVAGTGSLRGILLLAAGLFIMLFINALDEELETDESDREHQPAPSPAPPRTFDPQDVETDPRRLDLGHNAMFIYDAGPDPDRERDTYERR